MNEQGYLIGGIVVALLALYQGFEKGWPQLKKNWFEVKGKLYEVGLVLTLCTCFYEILVTVGYTEPGKVAEMHPGVFFFAPGPAFMTGVVAMLYFCIIGLVRWHKEKDWR